MHVDEALQEEGQPENGAAPTGPGVEGELPGANPVMIVGPGIALDPAERRFYRTRVAPIP